MAPRPQDVPDAELEVLRLLWDEGEATIRALVDRLYPGGGTSEYATAHASPAEERGNLVVRETRAGSELHGRGHYKVKAPRSHINWPDLSESEAAGG